MLLAFDIGNTSVKAALFRDGEGRFCRRLIYTLALDAYERKIEGVAKVLVADRNMCTTNFLFGLAHKISVIHWGQVISEGTPEELMHNEWVRTSDLGKVA